jgi:hypothetical protein
MFYKSTFVNCSLESDFKIPSGSAKAFIHSIEWKTKEETLQTFQLTFQSPGEWRVGGFKLKEEDRSQMTSFAQTPRKSSLVLLNTTTPHPRTKT